MHPMSTTHEYVHTVHRTTSPARLHNYAAADVNWSSTGKQGSRLPGGIYTTIAAGSTWAVTTHGTCQTPIRRPGPPWDAANSPQGYRSGNSGEPGVMRERSFLNSPHRLAAGL